MAKMPSSVQVVVDNVAKVMAGLEKLVSQKVLVGIPDTTAGRRDGPVSNAVIGYVQETGDPARNLPARPFLVPGVASIRGKVVSRLRDAGKLALEGKVEGVTRTLNALGLEGRNAVQGMITAGIPPPLAPSTVRGRLRKTQAGQRQLKKLRGAGTDIAAWGAANLTPLIDTGQLKNAITYVVREKAPQNWPRPK